MDGGFCERRSSSVKAGGRQRSISVLLLLLLLLGTFICRMLLFGRLFVRVDVLHARVFIRCVIFCV
jgi:hypothetical protein